MAPAAPSVWPCMDLVELTARRSACPPKTLRMAVVFAASLARVAVPWALNVADIIGLQPGVGDCGPHSSIGSSTSFAAPSPRIKPRRSFENGRQVSGDTTRMASHAFRNPRLKTASLPPVMAMLAAALRTIQKACPMA